MHCAASLGAPVTDAGGKAAATTSRAEVPSGTRALIVQLRRDDLGTFHVVEDFVDVAERHHGPDRFQAQPELQGYCRRLAVGATRRGDSHLEELQGFPIGRP